jgi:uncharacterized protein (DUF58 family)
MTTQDILKKVRKIELKTKWLTQQLFGGEYHSAFKGRGMSFSEVREYSYGDDVRNIDWNVTARTSVPHIKIFEEERELNVMLLIDVSASTYFGLTHQFKIETMIEIAAAIAFSATNNNDKVGAILFSDNIEKFIPPRKGRQNMHRIITDLVMHIPSKKGSNLTHAIEYLSRIEKKRSICFVLSDFIASNYSAALAVIAKRHDVIGVHVFDTFERELPHAGLIQMQDIEDGTTQWIDTENQSTRKVYNSFFEENYQRFLTEFSLAGADTLSINTADDYFKKLQGFFHKRAKR